jgi:hypothetical protein
VAVHIEEEDAIGNCLEKALEGMVLVSYIQNTGDIKLNCVSDWSGIAAVI